MKKSEINWKSGEVIHWDINDLNLSISLNSQIDILKEDLVLVRFGKIITLGLGWFPEFDPQGQFVLDVVKWEDWENPIWRLKFRELSQLMLNLSQAVEVADGHASTSDQTTH